MNIYLSKGETTVLLVDPRDTRDKGWIFSDDVIDVIFTIRETEDSEKLLQLHGAVEKVGVSADDPGTIAALVYTEDTRALPVGNYVYDMSIKVKGHWFDVSSDDINFLNEYAGLYLPIEYGRIKDGDDKWVEINKSWVELTNNATNYVSIDDNGEFHVNTDDFEADTYNLYKVITLDGFIVDEFPHDGGFAVDEATTTGLTLGYEAGKYIDSDYALQDKASGTILLKAATVNYVEIDTDGTITSNITKFTNGKYPLFKATTGNSTITEVEEQATGVILDERVFYVRGDSYIPSVKANCEVIWTPTKVDELEGIEEAE